MDQTLNEQLTIMLHKESAKILNQITFFLLLTVLQLPPIPSPFKNQIP